MSQEFSDLREQQKVFCDSLEDLIDQAEEQDKEETNMWVIHFISVNSKQKYIYIQYTDKNKNLLCSPIFQGTDIFVYFIYFWLVPYF